MSILLLFPWFIIALAILFYYEYKIRQIRRTEPKNKVHFYVARDNDGMLYLYIGKPVRGDTMFISSRDIALACNRHLELYGLNENDYNYLKFEDEPVEVFLDLEE